MVELVDAGSMPYKGDFEKFLEGSKFYLPSAMSQSVDKAKNFEERVIEAFIDKLIAGIEIPNYPQFRDMNYMFLEPIDGIEKVKGGFMEIDNLSLSPDKSQIKEVATIRNNLERIFTKIGHPIKLKICITGPYTLSNFFIHKDSEIFIRLGKILSEIVENNIYHGKKGYVNILVVDEPTFGFIDDPLIDYGSDGRENLIKAWETIFQKALSKGVNTSIHLHNTVNELYWDVKSLKILESHVDDPLYSSEKTKKKLESADKFLKASISLSIFDKLIKNHVMTILPSNSSEIKINEKIGQIWHEIKRNNQDPLVFFENPRVIQKRLEKIINLFGTERVLYAGPECGLKSFPTYESAIKCLKNTVNAVKNT
ncbi:MAG: hypothetical protein HWN67_19850 [Candidatus Helarchaeota archaeon]|nr:hypothetical protein [Candidatus Helarchaeota archaeon]